MCERRLSSTASSILGWGRRLPNTVGSPEKIYKKKIEILLEVRIKAKRCYMAEKVENAFPCTGFPVNWLKKRAEAVERLCTGKHCKKPQQKLEFY